MKVIELLRNDVLIDEKKVYDLYWDSSEIGSNCITLSGQCLNKIEISGVFNNLTLVETRLSVRVEQGSKKNG